MQPKKVVKTGFFSWGPPAKPIGENGAWVLKVWKGQVLTSIDGKVIENENAPFVFQASIENHASGAREFLHNHETFEAAKQEGYEVLNKK